MRRLLLRLTWRLWHPFIQRVLNRSRSDGHLCSRCWHHIAAEFDHTQRPAWRRVRADGSLPARHLGGGHE